MLDVRVEAGVALLIQDPTAPGLQVEKAEGVALFFRIVAAESGEEGKGGSGRWGKGGGCQ